MLQNKSVAKIPPPKVKGSSTRPVKPTVARAGKRPAVTILEVPGEQVDHIPSRDRLILATEVVNATLKSLTEAIKDPPARKLAQAKRKPLGRSLSSSSFSNGLESRSQTPLQPLCVNRLAGSPGKQNRSRRSSSTSTMKQTTNGLRAQAECARIAFAALRSLQCQKVSSTALPDLQLESGMSALIGKMLALGFDDIALRELRILKKRLEASKAASSDQGVAASTNFSKDDEKSNAKVETLAEILRFQNTGARGQLLSLIITTQLQVLKILAIRRETSATETAIRHLQFSVPYSPANLIRQQLDSEVPGSEGKVVRQLEFLAQALIALCPTISEEDERSLPPVRKVSAEIAFQTRVLAFQARALWWQISGHESDIAKEIIGPFTRCLATYNACSRSAKLERYETAKSALEMIKEIVQEVKGFRKELLCLTYQHLAESAQECSQLSEAICWIKKAKDCTLECAFSRAQLCNLNCRSASFELQSLEPGRSDDKLIILLKGAAKSLEGDLHGESADLDELLLAVASLRRSAFSVVHTSHRSSKAKEKSVESALVHECSNIVLLCARFLARYVGSGDSIKGQENPTVRRDQRRKLAAHFVTPTIESVVAIARLSIDSEADIWSSLKRGLQDCSVLASSVADSSTNEDRATSQECHAPSSFPSISNAYWYRYQSLKRNAKNAKSCRVCLLESIGLIRDRPMGEKLAGSLPLKLENFGLLCEDMRDYEKAADSFEEALHLELDSGLHRTAIEAAAVKSVPSVLQREDDLLPLSRNLSAYIRAAMKAIDQGSRRQSFYNANKISGSERGVLLERQLVCLLSTLTVQGPTSTTHVALNDIGILLLSTYEQTKYPVRRLRVVVRLLRLLLTAPEALGDALKDQLLQEPTRIASTCHCDTVLLSFVPHLITCQGSLISLRQQSPNIKDLESVIISWSKLVQENMDWSSLQTKVFDVADWLTQLEMLSEYLNMKGLEMYRVAVLNIAIAVQEAESSVQCSALVLKLAELGSQHVRLGYCGLAGSVLHKAQRYLDAPGVIGKVRLRWHLSYAEYALAIGNLKTW